MSGFELWIKMALKLGVDAVVTAARELEITRGGDILPDEVERIAAYLLSKHVKPIMGEQLALSLDGREACTDCCVLTHVNPATVDNLGRHVCDACLSIAYHLEQTRKKLQAARDRTQLAVVRERLERERG